jgi:hypothetical protein
MGSPLHPAAAQHGSHWIVLDGLDDLIVTLLPESVRYDTLWESSISWPPSWAQSCRSCWAFRYSPPRCCPIQCTLGVFHFFAAFMGSLHPAAAWHGSHQIVLDGCVHLYLHFTIYLRTAAVWHGSHCAVLDGHVDLSPRRGRPMRCTLQVFLAPSGHRLTQFTPDWSWRSRWPSLHFCLFSPISPKV